MVFPRFMFALKTALSWVQDFGKYKPDTYRKFLSPPHPVTPTSSGNNSEYIICLNWVSGWEKESGNLRERLIYISTSCNNDNSLPYLIVYYTNWKLINTVHWLLQLSQCPSAMHVSTFLFICILHLHYLEKIFCTNSFSATDENSDQLAEMLVSGNHNSEIVVAAF